MAENARRAAVTPRKAESVDFTDRITPVVQEYVAASRAANMPFDTASVAARDYWRINALDGNGDQKEVLFVINSDGRWSIGGVEGIDRARLSVLIREHLTSELARSLRRRAEGLA